MGKAKSPDRMRVIAAVAAAAALHALLPSQSRALTLEQKVGQLFMIAIDTEIAARYEPYIRGGKLGGAILRWDTFTGEEAKALSAMLQKWSGPSGFLIAVDHEGGPLFTQRTMGLTVMPGNMALGAAHSDRLTEQAAFEAARELRALGIHINFAPVLDANVNPANPIVGVRSFSEDPKVAAVHGRAAVRGYQKGGILPVVKHFPGHGDTHVDSHTDLPVIDKSLAELEGSELIPFKMAVIDGAPMLMPAHIVFPALDKENPVTLSAKAIKTYLRQDLGFGGVVVSDSLAMKAISARYSPGESAVRALDAGCDILLLGQLDFIAAYDGVLAAVKSGRISKRALDEAVNRVLDLKKKALRGAPGKPARPAESASVARKIARASATLLKNEGVLPLNKDAKLAVVVSRAPRLRGEIDGFFKAFTAKAPAASVLAVSVEPTDAEISSGAALAQDADAVVFGSYSWGASPAAAQQRLFRELLASGKPVAAVSLMNPYDAAWLKEAGALLAIYGITYPSLEAAVDALFGDLEPAGRLPVTIPGVFGKGSGAKTDKKKGANR